MRLSVFACLLCNLVSMKHEVPSSFLPFEELSRPQICFVCDVFAMVNASWQVMVSGLLIPKQHFKCLFSG